MSEVDEHYDFILKNWPTNYGEYMKLMVVGKEPFANAGDTHYGAIIKYLCDNKEWLADADLLRLLGNSVLFKGECKEALGNWFDINFLYGRDKESEIKDYLCAIHS